MATQFDAIPDVQFDAIPDVEFDAIPDEVVAAEAQRAATGAVQALDVMSAPRALDWSEANEKLDADRFYESESLRAQAALDPQQAPGLLAKSREMRQGITPYTETGQRLNQQERAEQQGRVDVATTAARGSTPSEAIGGLMGPVFEANVMPIVDSAARNAGAAAGGAIGAARFIPHPGTQLAAQFLLPMAGALMGAQAGGNAQEAVLRGTETDEETANRQRIAAEDFERNPGLSRIGAAAANFPFFRPGLAQFGRAASGDRGAILNLGLAGTIGGGMEVAAAMARGETAKAEDIAAGVFSNLIMNEPTRLGRRLGLQPSTEQLAMESAAKYEQAPIRIGGGTELESGLTSRGTTSTADVFAGVQKAPDIGIPISPAAETPPIPIGPQDIVPAIKIGDELVKGNPGETHQQILDRHMEANPDDVDALVNFDSKANPNRFVDAAGNELSREDLKDRFGVSDSQGLAKLQTEAAAVPEPAAEQPTSIQNAVTADERAARGIPPAEEAAKRAFGDVWDAVKTEVAENPARPDALLAELRKKPRALTDREDALILHRQIELQKSFDAAAEEVNQAAAMGDEPVRAEAMTRLNGARDALQDIYDVGKQAGTETGRGLNARKMMVDRDFTLSAMETRLRAEQGGKLSEPQLAKVKEQADTIAKTQEGMDKILAERDALKAQIEEDKAVDPRVKSLADRIIARLDLTAKNAATSLRGRLKNLSQNLSANPIPHLGIVTDVAKIAAAKTAKGAIEFAQWSAEMIKDFGEKVRPFLQQGWDQRNQFIDSEVDAVGGRQKRERSAEDKEKSAVKAQLSTLANRTAEYERRTASGDFSPMRKPSLDLSKNPEWVKLKAENDTAKAAYEKSRYEARKAQRTTEQKVRDTIADVWGASRPILASTDISAPGRQGIFFSLPDLFLNPVRLGRQLRTMFRSQFSESKFQQNEAAIKSRENADLYESSDLYLADIDHKPSAREEQFKSELAEKIPGIGRVVRGSSRGFSAFMNTVRADAMDAFVKWSGGKEKVSPETANFLAAAINDLSGRGNVTSRQAQGALEWLAKYLFSPRLWVSRFNTALLKPVWRDPLNRSISPRARAVVLGQYAKFGGALLALKFLAGLNGGEMEEDPRDSDFGKLQFGSKRYDVMGGIGNMVTLLARISTQKTKDDKGKLLRIAWEDEKRPERELGQILFNHLRNKGAPVPGAIYDMIYGRHPDRSKVTPTSVLKQTTVPITVSDTVEMFQKDSPAAALRDTLINSLGVSASDYSR